MPRLFKKGTKESEKARGNSESVGANSKSQKKVNKASKSKRNTSSERESSNDEMTQTERARKTKKVTKNNSDSKRDQILKIAPSSKTISKANNSKGNKRSSFCFTNIAREILQSNQSSSSGVEVTQLSQMKFDAKGGIEFAAAPDNQSGLIRIKPGGEKKEKSSVTELQFVVIHGTVECIFGDLNQKYNAGSTVSIPNVRMSRNTPICQTIQQCTFGKAAALGSTTSDQQQVEVQLCKEIEWAKQNKRAFLRQSLEARLIALYVDTGLYIEALELSSVLLKELKKLDDKMLLIQVQLLESKTYHALSNLSKARVALTSARTTANGIYCAPKMQGALDLQSGILYLAEERDFKTAYSYFYEALENFDSIAESSCALIALKYMLLCKIMLGLADDVFQIVSCKLAIGYSGRDIDAMKAVAQASHKCSLADFEMVTKEYANELEYDVIVKAHLAKLYDTMMEQNLCRIINPFSCIQVSHIANLIELPVLQVEKKLSQMILDKIISGILDQAAGVLILFEEAAIDKIYNHALETITNMAKVVATLYQMA